MTVAPSDLRILLEDDRLVAVDKPHGLPVIPERDGAGGATLRSLMEARFGPLLVVHRLDAGTGGIVLFARDAAAHRFLSMAFEHASVEKEYLAVAAGVLDEARTIDLPISAKVMRGRYRINFTSGRPSRTDFIPGIHSDRATLVTCVPHTGRTHQIRVHLLALGHPLVVDWLYNDPPAAAPAESCGVPGQRRPQDRRLPLFARRLAFDHPGGGRIELVATVSAYFRGVAADYGVG